MNYRSMTLLSKGQKEASIRFHPAKILFTLYKAILTLVFVLSTRPRVQLTLSFILFTLPSVQTTIASIIHTLDLVQLNATSKEIHPF